MAVERQGNGLILRCVTTELGGADEDGRRRPVEIAGSEHVIECGMFIASVGQQNSQPPQLMHDSERMV